MCTAGVIIQSHSSINQTSFFWCPACSGASLELIGNWPRETVPLAKFWLIESKARYKNASVLKKQSDNFQFWASWKVMLYFFSLKKTFSLFLILVLTQYVCIYSVLCTKELSNFNDRFFSWLKQNVSVVWKEISSILTCGKYISLKILQPQKMKKWQFHVKQKIWFQFSFTDSTARVLVASEDIFIWKILMQNWCCIPISKDMNLWIDYFQFQT